MNEIENLTNYYSSFINSKSGWNFFVGLKDYINYITAMPTLRKHTTLLNKELLLLRDKENNLEKKSVNELLSSKKKILKIIKNADVINPEITQFIEEIKKCLDGTITSSKKLSESIDRMLFNICISISEDKRFSLFKCFEDKYPENKNIYGNFIFSKTLKIRRGLTREIDYKKTTETWGDWIKLSLVPKFIEAIDIYNVPLEHGDVSFCYRLIDARLEYTKTGDDYKFSDIIPEYANSVTKIHAYLIRKINESSLEKSKNLQTSSEKLSKITSITIVNENERNKKRFVVNKNYIDSFEILESTSKNIISLVNAIINKTKTLKNINDPDACKSYLNFNSRCRIYKKNKKQIYNLTPIVEFKNDYDSNKALAISSRIKTEVITFAKYKKLLSQQKNRNNN